MTTTGSVLSPEMKLMSKPGPTSSSSNATPEVVQQVPAIMTTQPAGNPAILNRRSSWSDPPRQLRQENTATTATTTTTTTTTNSNHSATTATTTKTQIKPVVSADASIIDSALLAALRDPRERIGLLRLEQTLCDFVTKQPQDPFVDVGGPYNSIVKSPTIGYISPGAIHTNTNKSQTSFQRCILHRLADRFEITRENNMDGTIRLLKQPQTKVPSRLLLDVKSDEYSLVQSMDQVSLNAGTTVNGKPTFASAVSGNSTKSKTSSSRRNSSDVSALKSKNGSSSEKGSTSGGGAKKNKMKIMKRANSCPVSGGAMNRTNSNTSLKKKNSSLTDREKAYAEARARIFQQEQEEQQQQQAAANANSNAATNAGASSKDALPPSSSGIAPNASAAPFEPSTATTTISSAATASNVTASSNTTTTTTATNSKATFRDRNQDVIDPDFRRGNAVASVMDYDQQQQQQQHYTNPTNDYYGYYNAPQHYPRNQYAQHQQQPVLQQQQQQQQLHAWVPSGAKDKAQHLQHVQQQQGYHHYHQYPASSAYPKQQQQPQQPQVQYHHHHQQQLFSYIPSPPPTAKTTATTSTATTIASSDKVGG
ncbi:unnamed protein product [Cylindrotheca closterium]|uniref:SUZ domain-containing protein n=1 Tax=Cylindrotheca closterium TaxID=2856 RepID=A0AAD2FPJ9_9STRA|nr:unnamed protein product [Cylindrotheca closterium]